MTISVWRYSHLMLAVSSFIFILIASLTGIILAFEPISNQLESYKITDSEKQSVAKVINTLHENYDEVLELQVDTNGFVLADVLTKDGKSGVFYINPLNGKILGNPIEKATIFKWATNLHRSLFLKKTGRFFVALASFLLFLIAISGIILIVKRQGSFKKFFAKVINENFYQYYHIVFGRLSLIPIIIITLTGIYLSLEKFDVLPKHSINHTINFDGLTATPEKEIKDFIVFNNTLLAEVKRIEFPFSDDVEDTYRLELKTKELIVHQKTGEIISEIAYPFTMLTSYYSLLLHTGQGSIIWSIVLLLACIGILFFIYSGFKMTFTRLRKSKKVENTISVHEAEYIILVGSEAGNTYTFANSVFKAMQQANLNVFIDQLNNYTQYKNAKQLLIFTSTYGEGIAPTNATNFIDLLEKIVQPNTIKYAVVAFGSLLYPDFCQFGIDVHHSLQQKEQFKPLLPIHKINNQSYNEFEAWLHAWQNSNQIQLDIKKPKPLKSAKNHKEFKIVSRTDLNIDNTYLLRLKPSKQQKFTSGDLLSYIPEKDGIERLYSIAKYENDILLSIKKHDKGVVSSYFSTLTKGQKIKAGIQDNFEFHLPKHAKQAILIANGTGIAPFLGMINDNTSKIDIHLFLGVRTKTSLHIYKEVLNKAFDEEKLSKLQVAYSQENEKKYVQDILAQHQDFLAKAIKNEAIIMICGSVGMQSKVLELLATICKTKLDCTLSDLEINEQLKMDCY